eukprot:COSAG01_NODE_23664_length_806_cov_1.411598_1_plen_96_part_00
MRFKRWGIRNDATVDSLPLDQESLIFFTAVYDCSKMSWLLPYNRNYFLCNYQTYPQTDVVWVIGLLISPSFVKEIRRTLMIRNQARSGTGVPEYP